MSRLLTIADVLKYNAQLYPAREAIVFPDYKESITFADLDVHTNQFANFLIDLKIKKGQCVGLLLKDSRKLSLAILSLAKIGARAVPLDVDLPKEKLEELIKFIDIRSIIVEEKYQALAGNNSFQRVILKPQEGITSLPQTGERPKQFLSPVAVERQDDLICMGTSGSTGSPKLVRIHHQGIIANASAIKEHLRIIELDRFLSLTPLTHTHGFYNGLLMPMCCGATSVIIDGVSVFHIPRFWGIVRDYRISIVNIVPTIIEMLMNMKVFSNPEQKATLRFMICGTAPLKEDRREVFERANNIKVVCQYGLTETLINAMELLDGKRIKGSVGVPVAGEVKILDDGEIAISGPSVTNGYYGQEELNKTVFQQGAFLTGDLGRIDEQGFLFIEGRKKDLIIKGGKNISPLEAERVLSAHPAVQEVSVIGLPDEFYGEEVYAFVTLKGPQVTEQELFAFCQKGDLPLFICPKSIFIIDDLPKGPTGKIQKKKLKELGEMFLHQKKGVVRGAID